MIAANGDLGVLYDGPILERLAGRQTLDNCSELARFVSCLERRTGPFGVVHRLGETAVHLVLESDFHFVGAAQVYQLADQSSLPSPKADAAVVSA